MRDRTLGIILGGLNILLMAVCIVFYLGLDKTAPEITLGTVDYIYEEDLPDRFLMEAVTASDRQEGDLTDHVVVEKVVTDRVQKTATITYGVADSSGNVGRATRTMAMSIPEIPQLPAAGEAGNTGENRITEDNNEASEAETNQETQEEEYSIQNDGPETSGEKPGIVFAGREVTVKAGEQPVWESVMEEVQDDKDTREALLKSLQVMGEYDTEKAGEYYLTITITDSDGNVSNAYPMKLIVEE